MQTTGGGMGMGTAGSDVDLSGTYTGTVSAPDMNLNGPATLTITGNTFTLDAGGSPQTGTLTARQWPGQIAASMRFGTTLPATIVSVRAKKMGASGLSLTSVKGETHSFSFTTGGGGGGRRGRRGRRGTAGAMATPTDATATPADTSGAAATSGGTGTRGGRRGRGRRRGGNMNMGGANDNTMSGNANDATMAGNANAGGMNSNTSGGTGTRRGARRGSRRGGNTNANSGNTNNSNTPPPSN
jgi:hypothetical protein